MWRQLLETSCTQVSRAPDPEDFQTRLIAIMQIAMQGQIFITDNYVIRKQFFTFNIFPFSDLLWAYKKVTNHYTNFIPTGKSYGAILIFYGGSEALGGKERRVDEVLAFAANKAPWAILAFSSEIKEVFEKRTSEFCQAVEARRQELSQKR